MVRTSLVCLALLSLLGLSACGGGGGGGGDCTTPSSGTTMTTAEHDLATQALAEANAERAHNGGLAPLAWHEGAAQVGFEHSWDMHTRSFFDHVNPCGEDPGARLNKAGISWWTYGENIAQGYATAIAVVGGWMASTGHRDNILNPNFTKCGIGVYEAPGGTLWTMVLFAD